MFFFLLMSRILTYILLLLSITITFMFVWQHKPFHWNVLPLFLLQPLGSSLHLLNKHILFLCWCKDLHVNNLDQIIIMNQSNRAGKRAWILFHSLLACLWSHINFSQSGFHIIVHFSLLGLCYDTRHISVIAIWQTSWDTAVDSFFVTKATCYSPPGFCPFLGKNTFCASGHVQLCQLSQILDEWC